MVHVWAPVPGVRFCRKVSDTGVRSLRASDKEPRMTVSVFIGTSVDGFIARPDGALDFLPAGGGEPHGYDELIASVDALVIGRKTHKPVVAFPEWPFGGKRGEAMSSRL